MIRKKIVNKESDFICSECKATINDEDKNCPNCGADLSEVIEAPLTLEDTIVQPKFRALYFYSDIIQILGWIEIILAVILFLTGNESSNLIYIAGAAFLVITGLPIIAFGQYLKTHIHIEKNGREATALLRYIAENITKKDR